MRGLRRREAVVMDANQKKTMAFSLKDCDANAMITEPYMQKKVGPDELQKRTHFNVVEIKQLYRSFKETAPIAVIHRDLMRTIFREFFRRGDVEHYADLVFNAINTSHSGFITFAEYAISMSTLCRGTLEEKIEWMYRLYDPMNKGYVTCERMQHVMTAVCDLFGTQKRRTSDRIDNDEKYAQEIFLRFSNDFSSILSKKHFIEKCTNDPAIASSIDVFRSVLFK